jgi:hypothetical protein
MPHRAGRRKSGRPHDREPHDTGRAPVADDTDAPFGFTSGRMSAGSAFQLLRLVRF